MKEKIINGYRFTYQEAVDFVTNSSDMDLFLLANKLRTHFTGNTFGTCMIMNAKSGLCGENCKWCSQSLHNQAKIPRYKLVDKEKACREAMIAETNHVQMFSLVTSGRKLNPEEISSISETYRYMKKTVPNVDYCASLGLLTKDELQILYIAGVRRYHCNIETAPSFFNKVCTTHSFGDKIKTIHAAKEVGMQICSGGIIGMGETEIQRIEMAVALNDIGVDSIPINILIPIKGTPMEKQEPLSNREILRAFAIFRIINPTVHIRIAAGRLRIAAIEKEAFAYGLDASMVGNLLTTDGISVKEDMEHFKQQGYEL